MHSAEEKRLNAIKKVLLTLFGTERSIRDSHVTLNNQLLEKINNFDIEQDVSYMVEHFVSTRFPA